MKRDAFEDLLGEDDEFDDDHEEDEDDDGGQGFWFGRSAVYIEERMDHLPRDLRYVPKWDDDYEPDRELMEKLVACVNADHPVLLVGPKGSGKSSAIKMLAALVNQPLVRVGLTGETRVRDFVGFKTLDYEADEDSGEVFQVLDWVDGFLPLALRRNYWLQVDEIDAAPPGIAMVLQEVLEDERRLVILDNGSEVVLPPGEVTGLPHEVGTRRFRFFATSNTLGFGDETGLYAGTRVMNQATLDRLAVIMVDYPTPKVEQAIMESRTKLSEAVAKALVKFATLIRAAPDDTDVMVSTRQLVAWGKMLRTLWDGEPGDFVLPSAATAKTKEHHLFKLAYGLTVGDKLPQEDREFYAGVFQRHFGFLPWRA